MLQIFSRYYWCHLGQIGRFLPLFVFLTWLWGIWFIHQNRIQAVNERFPKTFLSVANGSVWWCYWCHLGQIGRFLGRILTKSWLLHRDEALGWVRSCKISWPFGRRPKHTSSVPHLFRLGLASGKFLWDFVCYRRQRHWLAYWRLTHWVNEANTNSAIR